MPITVIQGEQRGDEAKGRFVDLLAGDPETEIVARYGGGQNAGHTIVTPEGDELKLRLIPSGIAQDTENIIGAGTVLHPETLLEEFDHVRSFGFSISPDNLKIDRAAHLVLPMHVYLDEIREVGSGAQGSTKNGIAQAYGDKFLRKGVRAESILDQRDHILRLIWDGVVELNPAREEVELEPMDPDEVSSRYDNSLHVLGAFVTDTVTYLNDRLDGDNPARVIAEGAQGYQLDIDGGMYPFTTSSFTGATGASSGLGVSPTQIDRIIGVSKGVQSHVGGGPFVTEIFDPDLLTQLHGDLTAQDAEMGTVTGRLRRLGHLDLVGIKLAQRINGTHEIGLSKLDWVNRFGPELKVAVAYNYLGEEITVAPRGAYALEQCQPIYETLPGWSEDISHVRKFGDLPSAAQDYIRFIEEQTQRPITMIGVGARRDEVIDRRAA